MVLSLGTVFVLIVRWQRRIKRLERELLSRTAPSGSPPSPGA
jgi:hypothetical protein